jgi:hypothetical protein
VIVIDVNFMFVVLLRFAGGGGCCFAVAFALGGFVLYEQTSLADRPFLFCPAPAQSGSVCSLKKRTGSVCV